MEVINMRKTSDDLVIDKCDDCKQDITECSNCCDLSCACEDGCTCDDVVSGGGNAS